MPIFNGTLCTLCFRLEECARTEEYNNGGDSDGEYVNNKHSHNIGFPAVSSSIVNVCVYRVCVYVCMYVCMNSYTLL